MNWTRGLLATLAAGIVGNVLDAVVHGWYFQQNFYDKNPTLFRADMPLPWLIVGDFVAALVLVWVFDRVMSSFAAGAGGGAKFGFYAGVLVWFPGAIYMNMMFNGFSYQLAWMWIIYGVIWYVIVGAVVGATYKKSAA